MHFERLRQLLRAWAAALDVAQRIAQLARFAELVDVLTLSGPGDAAQDQAADAVVAEVAMVMAGDAGEGAILLLLIGPHLRLDVVNVHGLLLCHSLGGAGLGLFVAAFELRSVRCVSGSEDLGLGQQVHVVVDLVVDVEVTYVLRDRVVVIGEVEAHRCLQPLRLPEMPRTADNRLEPVVILGHRRRVDCHDATTTCQELHQILPLVADLDIPGLLRVEDEHVGLIELFLGREFHAALALCAASIEHGHPFLQKLREIMRPWAVRFFATADEDAQWFHRE